MKDALTKPRAARVRCIEISPELILDLLKVPAGGVIVGEAPTDSRVPQLRKITAIGDDLPVSARSLRAGIDERGCVLLVVEDGSFSEIDDGDVIPRLHLLYQEEVLFDTIAIDGRAT